MLNVHTRELGGNMKDAFFRPITFEKYRKPQVVEYPRHAIVLNPHHTRQQQQQQQRLSQAHEQKQNKTVKQEEGTDANLHNESDSEVDEFDENNKDNADADDDNDDEEDGNPYFLEKADMLCPNDAFNSLLRSYSKWQTIRPIGRGLVNLGNTCFANSVLQCFAYIPILAQYLMHTYKVADNQLGAPYDFAFALAETIREIHNIRSSFASSSSPSLPLVPLVGNTTLPSRYNRPSGRQPLILSSVNNNNNNNNNNSSRSAFTSTTPSFINQQQQQEQQYHYRTSINCYNNSNSNSSNNYNNRNTSSSYYHSGPYRPGKVIGFLKTLSPRFTLGRQCDAHEFAMQLLSACQKSILFRSVGNRKLTQLVAQSTSLYRICGGYLRSQVSWSLEEEITQLVKSDRKQAAIDLRMEHASAKLSRKEEQGQQQHAILKRKKLVFNSSDNITNNHEENEPQEMETLHSNTYELFTILSIDLAGRMLEQCLTKFFAPEQLHGRCYYTPREVPVYARKEYKLHLPPSVLMFQFKRFDAAGRKISKFVEYPLTLDVTQYCTPAAIGIAQKKHKRRQQQKKRQAYNNNTNNTNSDNSNNNNKYYLWNNNNNMSTGEEDQYEETQETTSSPQQVRLSEINRMRNKYAANTHHHEHEEQRQEQQQEEEEHHRSWQERHHSCSGIANHPNHHYCEHKDNKGEQEDDDEDVALPQNLYQYQLHAICIHEGNSLHFGHYYAVVKAANGMWYLCNDTQVSAISEDKALHMQAYMLFYSRIMPEADEGDGVSERNKYDNRIITTNNINLKTTNISTRNRSDCSTSNNYFICNNSNNNNSNSNSNNYDNTFDKTNKVNIDNNNNDNSSNKKIKTKNALLQKSESADHLHTNVSLPYTLANTSKNLIMNNNEDTNMDDVLLGRALTAEEEAAALLNSKRNASKKQMSNDSTVKSTTRATTANNNNANNNSNKDANEREERDAFTNGGVRTDVNTTTTLCNTKSNVEESKNKWKNMKAAPLEEEEEEEEEESSFAESKNKTKILQESNVTNRHFLSNKLNMKRLRDEVKTESDSDGENDDDDSNNNNISNNNSGNHKDEDDDNSDIVQTRKAAHSAPHKRLARTGREAIRTLEQSRQELTPSSTQRPAQAPQFQQRIRDPMWEMSMDRGRVKKVKSTRMNDSNIDSNILGNARQDNTNQFQKVAENRFDSRGRPLHKPFVK